MPRIIYSLEFDIADPDRPQQLLGLIAPLNRAGQSPHCRPIGKGRVIDLRVGDQLTHQGRCVDIRAVRAYRQHWIEEGGYVPSEDRFVEKRSFDIGFD